MVSLTYVCSLLLLIVLLRGIARVLGGAMSGGVFFVAMFIEVTSSLVFDARSHLYQL